MPLTAGATFAGFTIERRLGSGGMGEVYLARHPRLPRYDAIKLLPPEWSGDEEYRARFTREADLASTLWHPHIVGVHDRGEHEGQLWISMDFVDGNDAAQILAQRFPSGMPPEMVVAIVTAVASALDYAHGQGLLHRDVKPANIMITRTDGTEQPRILLADFGIARNVNETSGLTKTNTAVGTVAYAAPEQLVGDPLDGRTDQYALAATAYHLLTGSQPFPRSNPAVVISRHLTAAPPPISATMPEFPGLDGVFATALAKNPRDRFVRCGDFARALADYARLPSGPAASPPTPAPFPAAQPYPAMQPHPAIQPHPVVQYPSAQPSRTPTNPWVLVALAVTVMVAVGAIALAWQPWNSDESVTRAADSADRSTPRIADVPLPSEPPADSGCVGSVIDHHDIEHPSLGPMRIFLVQDSASGSPLRGCVSGVTADDRALPPIAVAAMENFGFANPATDATGNTFITYNPGRYNGVVILVPDATGFEVTGPDDEGFDASSHDFYYAELVGPGGNGEYTIRQSSNDCEPDCAGGTITTEDFRWNGRDYVS